MLSLGVVPVSSARFQFPVNIICGRSVNVPDWRKRGAPVAFSSRDQRLQGVVEEGTLAADEDVTHLLDSSVFDEVFTSVEKVGSRATPRSPRLVSVPHSTLIPDDWKGLQEYYNRTKSERRQESFDLKLEWARKRAAERRAEKKERAMEKAVAAAKEVEIEQASLRGEISPSASNVAITSDKEHVERHEDNQMRDLSIGSGKSDLITDRRKLPEVYGIDLADIQNERTFWGGESSSSAANDAIAFSEDLGKGQELQIHNLKTDLGIKNINREELERCQVVDQSPDTGLPLVNTSNEELGEWQDENQIQDLGTIQREQGATLGRAEPKVFHRDLVYRGLENAADSLKEEKVNSEIAPKNEDAPPQEEPKFSLTAEEKALLKSKKLNFARISSGNWSSLHTLAASGQVYLAAELLRKGAPIDQVDKDGLTPLHKAVQSERKTMIRMLLKAGANPLVLDNVGATIVHYCAQVGSHELAKLVLRHGADVNRADQDGWTPLHVAVQSGRLELIKALVYRGADISLTNKDGNTPFDLALAFGACFNFYEAIKFLKKRSVLDPPGGFKSRGIDDAKMEEGMV